LEIVDRRDDDEYLLDADVLKIEEGKFYMFHVSMQNTGERISNDESGEGYYVGYVKKVIVNENALDEQKISHLDDYKKSWNAWGKANKNMATAKKMIEDEEKNVESMVPLWKAEFDKNEKNPFRVIYVQWYDKRCPNNPKLKSTDLPWHGPYYPYMISKSHAWYGFVGHESVVAGIRMSRAGGKDYVKISKAEQNRLMSLPSRGKLFQELANRGSACIVEEPNSKKKSKSTGSKPIVRRRRRMRNKLSSEESSLSDSRTESEGMNFIIAFDNIYQANPDGPPFFFQTL